MVTGTSTHLAGGQFPWLTEDLCQEGGLDLEVLGHHVQAEEMAVNTFSRHG